MEYVDRFNLSFFIVTILVNILCLVVLFFYQRRKHRVIKIVFFNLLLLHVLSATNIVTSVLLSAESDKIVAGSKDLTAFLLLVYCLNLTILALQCIVKATKAIRNVIENRLLNITVVAVLLCWIIPIVLTLPLLLMQVEKNNDSKQLQTYFQAVLLITLLILVLNLIGNVYIAYRTWIRIDLDNLIHFAVNRKNVTMTILTTIIFAVSSLPYISYHLGLEIPSILLYTLLWLEKILVPICFMTIYAAKHLFFVLKSRFQTHGCHQGHSQMKGDKNITVINSFTRVQPVVSVDRDESPDSISDLPDSRKELTQGYKMRKISTQSIDEMSDLPQDIVSFKKRKLSEQSQDSIDTSIRDLPQDKPNYRIRRISADVSSQAFTKNETWKFTTSQDNFAYQMRKSSFSSNGSRHSVDDTTISTDVVASQLEDIHNNNYSRNTLTLQNQIELAQITTLVVDPDCINLEETDCSFV
ncbi:uncharacterized protein [Clytia hemisphaerica]|uniref:uncharacterized protein n=1 Tax=Clytia hemisphaerica TaxID=252671 RepID=UPI0034D3CEB5